MKLLFALACATSACWAQSATVQLPALNIDSTRVANPAGSTTFEMPVSTLRYEPAVDLQTRNFAESQADITIRGGLFENTGIRLGALTLSDPQTGHYAAEIPVAPTMLAAPRVVLGADHAATFANSTVGGLLYGWRPIRNGGVLAAGLGEHGLERGEFYQGFTAGTGNPAHRLGADFAVARSRADGAVAFGEHHFSRVNARLQLTSAAAQTDAFVGYQAKFFGWPNLYTPFNSNETENLQTVLYGLNHRVRFSGEDFLEAGVFHRRLKDDYAFNRFAAVGAVHPFQHTTRVTGIALGGHVSRGDSALETRAEIFADDLRSTSLVFGPYRRRTIAKLTALPSYAWQLADSSRVTARTGGTYDDSNRTAGAFSPVVELARDWPRGDLRRLYLSYAASTQLPSYTAIKSNPAAGLFRGNAALARATSRNLEAGLHAAAGDATLRVAVFHRRDDALVDWTFRRGVTARTANPVDLSVLGAEALVQRSWKNVDVILGYTALAKTADYRSAAVDASFYALNYARHRLTTAIVARLPAGFEVRMDNLARVQAANLLRTVGGDSALNSTLALVYRPPAWHGASFTLRADNLWDSRYQEIPAVPATPRQLSLGAAYAW
ncbi:MAG: hypothetical protein RLZZ15_2767 [Verrucomicrobiota bacterium]|jgi:hypothetical protein